MVNTCSFDLCASIDSDIKKSCVEYKCGCTSYTLFEGYLLHLTSDFGFGDKDTKSVYGFWNHFQNGVCLVIYVM